MRRLRELWAEGRQEEALRLLPIITNSMFAKGGRRMAERMAAMAEEQEPGAAVEVLKLWETFQERQTEVRHQSPGLVMRGADPRHPSDRLIEDYPADLCLVCGWVGIWSCPSGGMPETVPGFYGWRSHHIAPFLGHWLKPKPGKGLLDEQLVRHLRRVHALARGRLLVKRCALITDNPPEFKLKVPGWMSKVRLHAPHFSEEIAEVFTKISTPPATLHA